MLDGRSLLTDPAISDRCKILLEQRTNKIRYQQRLRSLLQRNAKLLSTTPRDKESILSRLEYTKTKIDNNFRLAKMKLRHLEEDIVRSGCPGVSL